MPKRKHKSSKSSLSSSSPTSTFTSNYEDINALADDELISSLTSKLCKDGKGSKKLRREYAKEMGEGFGEFLEDLEGIEDRIGEEGRGHEGESEEEDSEDDDDDDDDDANDDDESSDSDLEDDVDIGDDDDDNEEEEEEEDDGGDNDSLTIHSLGATEDDLIIKNLSVKLAKGKGKSKQLRKEWGEEMGEGFADFMDELDDLGDRLGIPGDEDDDEEDSDEDEDDDDDDSESSSSEAGSVSSSSPPPQPSISTKDTYTPTPGEDIYGRLTPSSSQPSTAGAYVPPHLRKKKNINLTQEGLVDSGLKGTLNRLSEKNVTPILRSVRSSTLPNSTILATFKSSLSSLNKIAPDSNVRQNVGFAYMISFVSTGASWSNVGVVLAEEAYNSCVNAARTDVDSPCGVNAASVIGAYFQLGHLSSNFVLGLLGDVCGSEGEGGKKNGNNVLEIANFILDVTGIKMARDMGEDERRVRGEVEDMVSRVVVEEGKGSWMKEKCIEKLKHLVKSKKKLSKHLDTHGLVTDADKTLRLVKEVRETCGDSKEGKALKSQDFRDAEKKGRWWKLGGVYNKDGLDGNGIRGDGEDDKEERNERRGNEEEDDRIATLAKKMKMNTAFKKKIFRTLLTSFDHVEFEGSVNSMNLTHKDTREVVRVVIEVCGREKKFNPFYLSILRSMIEEDRKEHKMTINLSYKDSLKSLDTPKRARNLGILASNLVGLQGLDFVYAFSDVDFGDLTPGGIVFFVYFFGTLLQELSNSEVESLALTIAKKDSGMAADVRRFIKESLQEWKGNVKESMWREKYKRILKLLKR